MIGYKTKNTGDKFDIAKCRESGYARVQYLSGQCYEDGSSVQRNLAKAYPDIYVCLFQKHLQS